MGQQARSRSGFCGSGTCCPVLGRFLFWFISRHSSFIFPHVILEFSSLWREGGREMHPHLAELNHQVALRGESTEERLA